MRKRAEKPRGSAEPADASGATNATNAADATEASEASVAQMQLELKRVNEEYLRALAEFDNTRKRLLREKEEFAKFSALAVVGQLLPIIDGLDQAVTAVDQQADPEAISKGVHLIYRQLLGLLEKEGVQRIPTVGCAFDPQLHEAVALVEAQDGQADGSVVEEVQVGYTMHGKVLRPAIVKVAKGMFANEEQTEEREA